MSGISVDEKRVLIEGPFDETTAMALHKQGMIFLKGRAVDSLEIILDLSQVTAIGSVALAVILSWSRFLKLRNQVLILESPPDNLVSIIRVCGVEELVTVRSPQKVISVLT